MCLLDRTRRDPHPVLSSCVPILCSLAISWASAGRIVSSSGEGNQPRKRRVDLVRTSGSASTASRSGSCTSRPSGRWKRLQEEDPLPARLANSVSKLLAMAGVITTISIAASTAPRSRPTAGARDRSIPYSSSARTAGFAGAAGRKRPEPARTHIHTRVPPQPFAEQVLRHGAAADVAAAHEHQQSFGHASALPACAVLAVSRATDTDARSPPQHPCCRSTVSRTTVLRRQSTDAIRSTSPALPGQRVQGLVAPCGPGMSPLRLALVTRRSPADRAIGLTRRRRGPGPGSPPRPQPPASPRTERQGRRAGPEHCTQRRTASPRAGRRIERDPSHPPPSSGDRLAVDPVPSHGTKRASALRAVRVPRPRRTPCRSGRTTASPRARQQTRFADRRSTSPGAVNGRSWSASTPITRPPCPGPRSKLAPPAPARSPVDLLLQLLSCSARACAPGPAAEARICAASTAALTGPALPSVTVATGMPDGICSVASSASIPFRAPPLTGMPMTGSVVCAARTPPRCAAPPAAAMMIFSPRRDAPCARTRAASSGVRCAEMTRTSHADPELLQRLDGLLHDRPVRIAAHDDPHFRLCLCSSSGLLSARRPCRHRRTASARAAISVRYCAWSKRDQRDRPVGLVARPPAGPRPAPSRPGPGRRTSRLVRRRHAPSRHGRRRRPPGAPAASSPSMALPFS